MPRGVHIAVIVIRPEIEMKIRTKHRLTGDQVRSAFVMQPDVTGNWEHHAVYGLRYVALGRGDDGRRIIAWFYEVDLADGTWNLGTARHVDRD